MELAKDRDVISAAALGALGVFILSQALQWGYIGPDGPGPGFFPTWYGLLMIALSLYLAVKAAIRPNPAQREAIDWRATGRALATWAMFAGAIALMEPLGFPVAFALMATGMIRLVMGKGLGTALTTGVIGAAAFWLVFPVALGVGLPTGWAWSPLWRLLGNG